MLYIYSYNESSVGAKNLATELKARRIKHEKSAFIGSSDKTVINWGSQTLPDQVQKCKILNPTDKIKIASNKLSFFKAMRPLPDSPRIPNFTSDKNEAIAWANEGKVLLARTELNGHSGQGISIVDIRNPDSFVEAPLYVEYVKKKDEYRVHFVNKKIIDFQRKAVRPDYPILSVNWKIRNLAGGFIFVRTDVALPEDVKTQAEKAITASGLDFGAIDLIFNEQSGKAYVLEINTAPGLMGTTARSYADAFRSYTE